MKTFLLFSGILLLLGVFGGKNLRQKFLKTKPDSRNYYLSSQGDDANSGTAQAPFRTLAGLIRIEFLPGDTLFLRGGDTFDGTLHLSLNGSEKKPIVVTSYGAGRATLDGGNREAVQISGSWFFIRNLNTRGSGRKTGNTTNGIHLNDAHHIQVRDVETSGFQKSGLAVVGGSDIILTDIYAHENGATGILLHECRDCEILDCWAENNPGDPTNLTNHSGNGILVAESRNVLIDYCVATNNGWDMPRQGNGPVGIWAYQTDSILIQHCIAYHNKTSSGGKDGGGFDLDGGVTNSTIQYCLSYENEGAGYGLFQYACAQNWRNNTIRYNVSIDDGLKTAGAGGILVWNGGPTADEFADCFIYNNLIYNTKKPPVMFDAASANRHFIFANNIFLGKDEVISGPASGERFLGNVWWSINGAATRFRGYESLLAWAQATGQEQINGKTVGWQVDPLLRGHFSIKLTDPHRLASLTGFQLSPNSPIRNRGLDLKSLLDTGLPQTDFYGHPIPAGSGVEPGVFEFRKWP